MIKKKNKYKLLQSRTETSLRTITGQKKDAKTTAEHAAKVSQHGQGITVTLNGVTVSVRSNKSKNPDHHDKPHHNPYPLI